MKTLSANKLFTLVQVGPMELKHRVVMAPLTRSRSVQPGSIPICASSPSVSIRVKT
jgi:N-ethylmaleimide reductase